MHKILATYLVFILIFSSVSTEAQVDFTFTTNIPDTIYITSGCTAPLDWGHPGSVSADCNTPGCAVTFFDVVSITPLYNIGDPVPGGETVLITYMANDDMGSTAFFGFDIDFVDTISPTFTPSTLPPDVTLDCLESGPVASPVVVDNCPNTSVVFQESTPLPTGCGGGMFTRKWTAEDNSGSTAEYIQTITINPQTTPPTIESPPADMTIDCLSNLPEIPALNWVDNCGNTGSVAGTEVLINETPEVIFRSWTYTDECGNTSTVAQNITLSDQIQNASHFSIESGNVIIERSCYGIVLKSPEGSCFKIVVDENGQLETVPEPCP